jgi:pyruvate dehydrogenase E2 component (dihydrolipoamide acetyltransferase)
LIPLPKGFPEHEVILMPALSPTMTAGNIGHWHKKPGDRVVAGDVLCEIETDKATMDFEIQEDGFLAKILMPEGMKDAEVGKPLAIFVKRSEDAGKFESWTVAADKKAIESQSEIQSEFKTTESQAESKTTASPVSMNNASSTSTDRIKASPLAKRAAKELGIGDLASVFGSGPGGRIVKADVLAQGSVRAGNGPSKQQPSFPSTIPFVDVPVSSMRRVIAARLTESKQQIPHYYLRVDIEMDRILELRTRFNTTPALQEAFGPFKLSVNDFIVKASALALLQVPEVNSAWMGGDKIRQYSRADVCVAVATSAGLITPIVPEADQKGLLAISAAVKDLSGRARNNKLRPEEFQGGSFTISNLGMYGVDAFTAIINPPQAAILAVGGTSAKLRPCDVSSKASGEAAAIPAHGYRVAQVMSVTLSCDHRVVDGATGAKWLAHFKRFLEDPEQMIL